MAQAGAMMEPEDDMPIERLEQFMKECLAEQNLLGDRNKIGRRMTEEKENCLVACLFIKTGLMSKTGVFNEDKLFYGVPDPEFRQIMKKRFDETLSTCKKEAKDDICKLAACISRQPRDFYM